MKHVLPDRGAVAQSAIPKASTTRRALAHGLLGVITLTASLAPSSIAHAGRNVTGIWYNDTGKGAIELFPCGSYICGQIVWLKQPLTQAGEPQRDARNPAPERRKRPICGLQIIAGAEAQSDGTWDGGSIYDPNTGKSYNVAIERLGSKELRITGYLGAKLFGRSFTWLRAPSSLPKCAPPT